MIIESRTIVGAAGAFALVGAVLWGSALVLESPPPQAPAAPGSVEIRQLPERSWAVEVKDLGGLEQPVEVNRTAAAR